MRILDRDENPIAFCFREVFDDDWHILREVRTRRGNSLRLTERCFWSKIMKILVRFLAAVALSVFATDAAQAQRQPGGGFGGGFGGGGAGSLNLRSMLGQSKPLQEELKLSEEQIESFTEFNKKQGDAMRAFGFGIGGSDEDQLLRLKAQVKMTEERIEMVKKTLDKTQYKRLTQIEMQQMGMSAFTNERIAKQLKITEEQKEKIQTVTEDLQKESRELQRGAFGGGGFDQEKIQEMQKKMKNLREEAQEKLEKSLTDDQRSMWKEMVGESFDTSKLVPMFTRPKN